MGAYEIPETAARRIRAHEKVIEIGLRVDDEELAHAILDLARTSRRELVLIGLAQSFTEPRVTGYEMLLTQHLMPVIAMRLNRSGDRPLLRSREEIGDGRYDLISDQRLRTLTGLCWSKSDFARIGAEARARLDPTTRHPDQVFASEVIGREPSNGNLVEIALGRCAAPLPGEPDRDQDWFAARLIDQGRLRGIEEPSLVWTPEMRAKTLHSFQETDPAEPV